MRRSLGAFGSLGLVAAIALPGASLAGEPTVFPTFDVVVLATPHDVDAQTTEVRALHVDTGGVHARTLGVVPHLPRAVVRGDARGATTWVVADESAAADWGSALYEVGATGSRRVLGGIVHAGRPLASTSGDVFVERGVRGAWPSDAEIALGALRVDAIDIDAYAPSSGAVRHVYSAQAYTLHIAGEVAGELVVYRVDRAGASILAVDERLGTSRVVASVLPYARDFSIDAAGSLVFSNRDAIDPHAWVVSRMDLGSGTTTRLHTARDNEPAALAFGASIAWSSDARRGLTLAGREIAPLGAGFDAPVLATRDGSLVAFMHIEAGQMDSAAVLDTSSDRAMRLDRDERVTVLALRGDAGGAR